MKSLRQTQEFQVSFAHIHPQVTQVALSVPFTIQQLAEVLSYPPHCDGLGHELAIGFSGLLGLLKFSSIYHLKWDNS